MGRSKQQIYLADKLERSYNPGPFCMVILDLDSLWRARLIGLADTGGEDIVRDWPGSFGEGQLSVNTHVLSPQLFCSFGTTPQLQGHWRVCLTMETGVANGPKYTEMKLGLMMIVTTSLCILGPW